MTVQRVGIVAKQGLVAASEHVSRLGPWLRERGIEAIYERDTATLAAAAARGATAMTREALPREVDLVIVLRITRSTRIVSGRRMVPAPCAARQGHCVEATSFRNSWEIGSVGPTLRDGDPPPMVVPVLMRELHSY